MGSCMWGYKQGLGFSFGFRAAVSGVISRVTILITHIRRLTTPLITTHEPPSKVQTARPQRRFQRASGPGNFSRTPLGLCGVPFRVPFRLGTAPHTVTVYNRATINNGPYACIK